MKYALWMKTMQIQQRDDQTLSGIHHQSPRNHTHRFRYLGLNADRCDDSGAFGPEKCTLKTFYSHDKVVGGF